LSAAGAWQWLHGACCVACEQNHALSSHAGFG